MSVSDGRVSRSLQSLSFIHPSVVLTEYSQLTFFNERFFVKLSINNHIVGLVHKNRIIRTCLMYHAAYKVEFQRFKRSYSQLTFLNFFIKYHKSHWCVRGFVARNVRLYIVTCPLRREILLIKSVGWSFSSQNWEH